MSQQTIKSQTSSESNTAGHVLFQKRLRSTKQKGKRHKIAGFDIETCDDNKTFVCCSLVARGREPLFFTKKEDFLKEISCRRKWGNYWIFATNLGFDFFGMMFGTDYIGKFGLVWRGSDLISAKAYYTDKGLSSKVEDRNNHKYLQFVDTMNYIKFGVKDLGDKLLKMKKLDYKEIGQMPRTIPEWAEMKKYNIQDATITLESAHYIQDSIIALGGDMKLTIASCAMKLFKNKYLEGSYIIHDKEILLNIFKAYFGGRTEVFKRGLFKNLYYHDVNSMYPYIMQSKSFPNPNSLRVQLNGNVNIINDYEGVSHVVMFVPKTKYPILPYRTVDNVVFPYGVFEGWYTNIELREAVKNGAKYLRVFECYYYTELCRPFVRFVDDLYRKRLQYKADNNPMHEITKSLLNNLYGKFNQKFIGKDDIKHINCCSIEEIQQGVLRIGDFVYLKKDSEPSSFNVNIWGTYVTAYARLLLRQYIKDYDAVYVDTDSIICEKKIEDRKELGALKIEHFIEKGVFVRPKMYAFVNNMSNPKDSNILKCKGVNLKRNNLGYLDFLDLLKDFKVTQQRFTKFKTSLKSRGDLQPNQIVNIIKEYGLEDKKRLWKYKFNPEKSQDSEPLCIVDVGVMYDEIFKELSEEEKIELKQ
jgi:hypothetical protein